MKESMTVLTYLFALVGIMTAVLAALSCAEQQRKKYPILARIETRQMRVLFASIGFCAVAIGGIILKDSLTAPALAFSQGPGGELAQKATVGEFERQAKETAADSLREAREYFNAAERDFEAGRYANAADRYRKSTSVLPTMPAYLNLSLSLVYASDLQPVEGALYDGIQMARKGGNRQFEGAFLNVIGMVYAKQGKLEEALKVHYGALGFAQQICDPPGQAIALANLGIVYAREGKRREALDLLEKARTFFLMSGTSNMRLQAVEEIIERGGRMR